MNKTIPRLYIEDNLNINETYILSKNNTHYLENVLRLNKNDIVEIFNNTNNVFFSKIIYINKKIIQVKIFSKQFINIESPIHIHLGQVICKNDKKMDFVIQKSIEMGVNIITPLLYQACNIKHKNINISNKIQRWKKIAISACQQCKRNIIPDIREPIDIFLWCKKNNYNTKIIFHPESILTLNQLQQSTKYIQIIIGSEQGFSDEEIKKIIQYQFTAVKLGPRILRTETAAIAAITALQIKFGDLQ